MHKLLILCLVIGCHKQTGSAPAPVAGGSADAAQDTGKDRRRPATELETALASIAAVELRTSPFAPTQASRELTDAAEVRDFVTSLGEADHDRNLRRCPDKIIAKGKDASGAIVIEVGFCGSDENLSEGAEVTLPGRERTRLHILDAARLNALLRL